MSKKDAYERAERELAAKQGRVQNLQQQKANLEIQGSSLQEIAQLDSQIQSLQAEVGRLQPQSQRLKDEYAQSQATNQTLNYQVNNLNEQIDKSTAQKSVYDISYANIDAILSKYSEFAGQRVDPIKMVVQKLPQSEMHNSTAAKEACEKQSKEAFDELLKKTTDINAVDSQGMSLLMYSLKHGFWYGVDKLLELRADVDIADNNDCNALHYASTMPHMNSIMKIIERSNDINLAIQESGDTPLHCLLKNVGIDKIWGSELSSLVATRKEGNTLFITEEIFFTGNFILDSVGNVTFEGSVGGMRDDGFTINQKKALLICKALQSKGADFTIKDNLGLSPYFYVCKNQQKYLINQLKAEKIIDPEKLDQTGFEAAAGYLLLNDQPALRDFISKHPLSLKGADANGDTLLHYAVQLRNLALVSLLTDSGTDQNLQNKNGLTPLFLSCAMKNTNIAQYFIDKNPNIYLKDINGFGSLHWAVELRDTQILQNLLNKGADINLRDNNGYTVLYWMAKYGWQNEATWLIDHGAYVNIPDKNGIFPIHIAAALGFNEVLKIFLNKNLKIGNATSLKMIAANKIVEANIEHVNKIPAEMIDDLAKYNSLNQQTNDSNKVTPLYLAVQEGKTEAVELLLNLKADINAVREDSGDTALTTATIKEDTKMVNLLLNRGAKADIANRKGNYPIHLAAARNSLEIIKLLSKYTDINQKTNDVNKVTPLHAAAQEGKLEAVKLLLNLKADINAAREDNLSPLHMAISGGHIEVAKELVTRGANVNTSITSLQSEGETPLHTAARQQNSAEIIKLMLDKGANINAMNFAKLTPTATAIIINNVEVAKVLVDHEFDVNKTDTQGLSPWHYAAYSGNLSVAEYLRTKIKDIDHQTTEYSGATALLLAAQQQQQSMLEWLISIGANINAAKKGGGYTALMTAVVDKNVKMVEFLLSKGANANIAHSEGYYPIHLAASSNEPVIINLIAKQSNVNQKSNNAEQITPLWAAAQGGAVESVKILLSLGADVDAPRASNGSTPLHMALVGGYAEVMKELISNGAALDIKDVSGNNLLHLSSKLKGGLDVVKILLTKGFDVNAKNVGGGTPALQAIVAGHEDTVIMVLV